MPSDPCSTCTDDQSCVQLGGQWQCYKSCNAAKPVNGTVEEPGKKYCGGKKYMEHCVTVGQIPTCVCAAGESCPDEQFCHAAENKCQNRFD